jgi:uncharacterized protein (DUF983 family)
MSNEQEPKEYRKQDVTVFNRDIALFILACIVLLGAILLTALRVDVPVWLIVAVSNVVVFYFGLQIQGNK